MAHSHQADSDAAAIRQAKRLLRHAILLSRQRRPEPVRRAADHARFALLRPAVQQLRPTTVAAYLSSGSEPGTLELIGWLASQGVRVVLPVLNEPTGTGHPVRPDWAAYAGPDQLRLGPFSILEPTTPRLGPAALDQADLVICPGLAASPRGQRLGRGGGWYDAALAFVAERAPVWALLNDDELLDTVPTDSWDVPVDAIATPTRLVTAQPGRRRRT